MVEGCEAQSLSLRLLMNFEMGTEMKKASFALFRVVKTIFISFSISSKERKAKAKAKGEFNGEEQADRERVRVNEAN